jgi:uncharacterized cupin superfamily protein/predicted enzyme related to lactoylglutathione lyase
MDLRIAEVQAFVSDLPRARKFYEDTLGFPIKKTGKDWLIFDAGGLELLVMAGAQGHQESSLYGKRPSLVICLSSRDIESDFAELKHKGVEFYSEINTVPQGRFVAFHDPDGNQIELIQRNETWDEECTGGKLTKKRPEFIKHFREIQEPDQSCYKTSGSKELLSIGSPFGKVFGLKRLGIHHETLPSGRRTSWPHAEKTEDEFVYVIEGNPDVWVDGHLYGLRPGDGVGFPSGTGIAHTFINNSDTNVRLLVVGDANREDNKITYPLHPKRNELVADSYWGDAPCRELGPHDGLPNKLRENPVDVR